MPTPLLSRLPLAAVDTETTGVDPDVDDVVEVAAIHVDPGASPRSAFHARVRPVVAISAGASAVHGIVDADLAECPPFEAFAASIASAVEGRVVLGHNVLFDIRILSASFRRAGRPIPDAFRRPLCTLVWNRARRKGKGHTLREVAEAHRILLDAHGALGDALAVAWMASDILSAAEERCGRSWDSLDDLIAWQRVEALEQEAGYASWSLRTRGVGADCPWHRFYGIAPPAAPPRASTTCTTCGGVTWTRITRDGQIVSPTCVCAPELFDPNAP